MLKLTFIFQTILLALLAVITFNFVYRVVEFKEELTGLREDFFNDRIRREIQDKVYKQSIQDALDKKANLIIKKK